MIKSELTKGGGKMVTNIEIDHRRCHRERIDDFLQADKAAADSGAILFEEYEDDRGNMRRTVVIDYRHRR